LKSIIFVYILKEMKNNLLTLLLFFSLAGFSQQKTKDDTVISKIRISEAKLLNEIRADLPKDIKSMSTEFVFNKNGKITRVKCNSLELNEKVKTYLKSLEAGSSFYSDVMIDGKSLKVLKIGVSK